MYFLLFYELIDHDKRTPYRKAHLEYCQKACERGDLILAGPLLEPEDWGVSLLRGTSEEEVEKFAKSDPFVKNGLVKSWRVRKWQTVISDGSIPP